jgi:hypothetical protein
MAWDWCCIVVSACRNRVLPLRVCTCVCTAEQPTFDVAEEYTELLYRQFLVLLGVAVFPLITVVAVVSLSVE